jgi:hypothetical protein
VLLRRTLFCSSQSVFQPQYDGIEKTELANQPGKPVEKYKSANEQQQRAAKYFDGVEILSEALIKFQDGTAKPAEYTANSKTPRAIVSLAAASASTVVRIGPMHGVQPKANAKPSRKPLQIPGWVLVLRR